MWLIFLTEDNASRYMIEVEGCDTLESCVAMINQMKPIKIPNYQLSIKRKTKEKVLLNWTKTVESLKLPDRQIIMIKAAKQPETPVRILRSKSCQNEGDFQKAEPRPSILKRAESQF